MCEFLDASGVAVIAFAIAYVTAPFMAYIARRFNIMDHPSRKKAHAHATPLLGGIAIYTGFIIALLTTVYAEKALVGALISGTILIVFGGVVDDKRGMSPKRKLRWQCVAALLAAFIAARMGLKVVFIKNLPQVAVAFTVVWVVAMTNSFNLLDNLNGLSSGIAGISALFFGLIALIQKDMTVAVVSFSLFGACAGFLLHNFPKATMFMGDAGSLFLGFMLAFIAVWGSWETEAVITSLAVPVLILAYPLFDTALVMIKRLQDGRSIFQGGKDHSSHRLALLGFKKKRAVLVLYFINTVLGILALAVTLLPATAGYFISIGAVSGLLLFGIRLGRVRIKYREKGVRA